MGRKTSRSRTPQRPFSNLRSSSRTRGRSNTPKKDASSQSGNNSVNSVNSVNSNNNNNNNNNNNDGGSHGRSRSSSHTPKFKFKKLIPRVLSKQSEKQVEKISKPRTRRGSSQSPAPPHKPVVATTTTTSEESEENTNHQNKRTTKQTSHKTPQSSPAREERVSVKVSPKRKKEKRQFLPPSSSPSPKPSETCSKAGEINTSSSSTKSPTKSTTPIKKLHHESERDGFCRRVDSYDGQIIIIDGKNTYNVGNYLGGGVAGVVYEGHRLRPLEEYPIRTSDKTKSSKEGGSDPQQLVHRMNSLLNSREDDDERRLSNDPSLDTMDTTRMEETGCTNFFCSTASPSIRELNTPGTSATELKLYEEGDLSDEEKKDERGEPEEPIMKDEPVAIKILNPVGFRLLSTSACASAIVLVKGEDLTPAMAAGEEPMTEKNVWWLVNPSSRNLRTLQRAPSPLLVDSKQGHLVSTRDRQRGEGKPVPMTDLMDRGTPERGLRLSLVSAYKDPKSGTLREVPLTRCIEIWGHAPFGTSEKEFEEMMDAIERVNEGQRPRKNRTPTPKKLTKETRSETSSGRSKHGALKKDLSGLDRAVNARRKIVYKETLNAYIAVTAVPAKFIRWLRQRRAATKEIRNMMRIGRHKNVVHLFEVMELIQDSKSTMFLVLELVRGGELFDLISSNSASTPDRGENLSHLTELEQGEYTMLNFFRELASGIAYCHANGIAHRDLKPENLLVHNGPDGKGTLKIADFGLSATFAITQNGTDNNDDSFSDHVGCGIKTPRKNRSTSYAEPVTGLSPIFKNSLTSALSFLTCGSVDQISECFDPSGMEPREAKSLQRMTSIVGSPHYVAPEIISQSDDRKGSSQSSNSEMRGYDGTKADVWSAGVILYAMLFRSLPFGEDLIRCPRYQSFTKWYGEARRIGNGRRKNAEGALKAIDLDGDMDDLGPQWFFPSHTSPESRDIIVAMLNPIPSERLSIEQVLKHVWIRKRSTR